MLAELTGADPIADAKKADEPPKTGDSFAERAVKKIVDNIQVFVERIHIRFEDDITSSDGIPWAMGVTLQGFHAESTDEEGNPTFISSSGAIVHKSVTLTNLAVYHDCGSKFIENLGPQADIRKISKKYIYQTETKGKGVTSRKLHPGKQSEGEGENPPHHFVLSPLSSTLKAKLNSDDTNFNLPKIAAELILQSIDLSLSQAQWRTLDDFLAWTKNFQVSSPYRELRPPMSPKQNPSAWWNYAYQCVVKENQKKRQVWDWERLKQRKILRKKYVALYKKKQRKTIRPEGLKEITRLELDEELLSVEDILVFRSIASTVLKQELELEKKTKEEEKAKKEEEGWEGGCHRFGRRREKA